MPNAFSILPFPEIPRSVSEGLQAVYELGELDPGYLEVIVDTAGVECREDSTVWPAANRVLGEIGE